MLKTNFFCFSHLNLSYWRVNLLNFSFILQSGKLYSQYSVSLGFVAGLHLSSSSTMSFWSKHMTDLRLTGTGASAVLQVTGQNCQGPVSQWAGQGSSLHFLVKRWGMAFSAKAQQSSASAETAKWSHHINKKLIISIDFSWYTFAVLIAEGLAVLQTTTTWHRAVRPIA